MMSKQLPGPDGEGTSGVLAECLANAKRNASPLSRGLQDVPGTTTTDDCIRITVPFLLRKARECSYIYKGSIFNAQTGHGLCADAVEQGFEHPNRMQKKLFHLPWLPPNATALLFFFPFLSFHCRILFLLDGEMGREPFPLAFLMKWEAVLLPTQTQVKEMKKARKKRSGMPGCNSWETFTNHWPHSLLLHKYPTHTQTPYSIRTSWLSHALRSVSIKEMDGKVLKGSVAGGTLRHR